MGYVYGILAAMLFGANGSLTKVILDTGVTPAQLTFMRVTAVMLISGAVLLATDRKAFRLSKRQLATMAVLGIAGVAMLQYCYALALNLLPVGIALLFEYLAVPAVAIISYVFFKDVVKPRLWVAIAAVLAGMAVVSQIWASSLSALGILFALGAAAALTIYFIVGERQVGNTSPMAVAFWSMLFACLFWSLFSGWWQMDLSGFGQQVSLGGNLQGVMLPLFIPLGASLIGGSFFSFYFSFRALSHLPATAAGIVAASEVIFAFVVAWLWLGEALTLSQMLGALLVLAGIIVAQTARPGKVLDLDLAMTQPVATIPSSRIQ